METYGTKNLLQRVFESIRPKKGYIILTERHGLRNLDKHEEEE